MKHRTRTAQDCISAGCNPWRSGSKHFLLRLGMALPLRWLHCHLEETALSMETMDTSKELPNFKGISKLQKTGICLLGQKVTLLGTLHPVPSAEWQGNSQGLELGQWEHDFLHHIGDWKVLKEWNIGLWV